MIEVLNKKEKLEGFIDGKKYLNKKKKLMGFLENDEFKDRSGYTLLILKANGAITWNEGEQQGYLKEGKIYSSLEDKVIFEFKKEKAKILGSEGDTILYLKGDLDSLEDNDFFGIAGQFLGLFA
ncbi:MAG: hypothetical protein HWN81_07495 [Candidatus Lokiarchaeota archaeon]|nr:hypothetical protein [Candidatus Lokiarchaeota archaeon]